MGWEGPEGEERLQGTGNGNCKGPEAGLGLVCLRNSKQARVVGTEWMRRAGRVDTGSAGMGQIMQAPQVPRFYPR